jgi:hypothetical protein
MLKNKMWKIECRKIGVKTDNNKIRQRVTLMHDYICLHVILLIAFVVEDGSNFASSVTPNSIANRQ